MTAATRTARWTAKRAELVASLAIAKTTYNKLLAQTIDNYNFNSGEGSQAAKRRGLAELKEQIDKMESEIDAIDLRLRGGGVIGVQVSRWGDA